MCESLMDAVRNSTVIVERGKNFEHPGFNIRQSPDIQKGFLLPCKRGLRKVFCSS